MNRLFPSRPGKLCQSRNELSQLSLHPHQSYSRSSGDSPGKTETDEHVGKPRLVDYKFLWLPMCQQSMLGLSNDLLDSRLIKVSAVSLHCRQVAIYDERVVPPRCDQCFLRVGALCFQSRGSGQIVQTYLMPAEGQD